MYGEGISCLNPISMALPKWMGPARFTNHYFVSCRKCVNCKRSKFLDTISCTSLELLNPKAKYRYFITLTYNNFNLPEFYLLPNTDENAAFLLENNYVDWVYKVDEDYFYFLNNDTKNLTDFIKRLKRDLARKLFRKDSELYLGYLYCSEYGGEKKRPHFHICLFSEVPLTKDYLKSIWTKGFVKMSPLNNARITYTASYCLKKLNKAVPPFLEQEKHRLSYNIGKHWYIEHIDQIKERPTSFKIKINGYDHKLPDRIYHWALKDGVIKPVSLPFLSDMQAEKLIEFYKKLDSLHMTLEEWQKFRSKNLLVKVKRIEGQTRDNSLVNIDSQGDDND